MPGASRGAMSVTAGLLRKRELKGGNKAFALINYKNEILSEMRGAEKLSKKK